MKGFCPLHPLWLLSSSFFLFFFFAHALTRRVVTMVSNVSDRSDCLAWRVASRPQAGMPHAVGNARVHARPRGRVAAVPGVPERPCAERCARVQTGVCQNKTAAASCTRERLPVASLQKGSRSAEISTNQTCRS